jgi:GAF domain-containing protein
VVDTSAPFLFHEGYHQQQDVTLCQAILDKKLPQVIPDLTAFPEAMKLPAATMPRLRSYVSVPVTLSNGSLYGTFCARPARTRRGTEPHPPGRRPPAPDDPEPTAPGSSPGDISALKFRA